MSNKPANILYLCSSLIAKTCSFLKYMLGFIVTSHPISQVYLLLTEQEVCMGES